MVNAGLFVTQSLKLGACLQIAQATMQVHNLKACVRKATCLPQEPNCGMDLAITERAEMIISIVLKRHSYFFSA